MKTVYATVVLHIITVFNDVAIILFANNINYEVLLCHAVWLIKEIQGFAVLIDTIV